MAPIQHLPGITSQVIQTPRLRIHALFSGADGATPVLFIHGNLCSSTFWEETMLALPRQYRAIAPDLRGYGDTEDKLIDATLGYGDWVQDLLALQTALGFTRYHVVGYSLGGGVVFSLVATAPGGIISVTLAAPASPYGVGGTKDVNGTPCYPDFAGSGAGTVNPVLAQRIAAGDRGSNDPRTSPRVVMNNLYWNPPFRSAREEDLLSSMLATKTGPDRYPGDAVGSPNWPGYAPGKLGPTNALSPKYVGDTVRRFLEVRPKPPILWVRGSADQIVSDYSSLDAAKLGKEGRIPDWPGPNIYPPQPKVSQTRAVLDRYAAEGGNYREKVIADTGHTPFLEKPDEFMACLIEHLAAAG